MSKTEFIDWDIQNYLKTPEQRAAYLNAAIEDNDPYYLQVALGDLARAEGMSKVAEEAHLSRESLYRSLGENGNPAFRTVLTILEVMGLKLTVAPR